MTPDDVKALLTERARADLLARLRAPRLTRSELIEATGAPPAQLSGWLARGVLRFDADAGRVRGGHRRFSALDAGRAAAAVEMTRLGFAASSAAAVAEAVVGAVQNHAALLAAPVAPLFDPCRDRLLIDFDAGRPRVFTPDAAPQSVALISISVWPTILAAADLTGDRLLTITARAAA